MSCPHQRTMSGQRKNRGGGAEETGSNDERECATRTTASSQTKRKTNKKCGGKRTAIIAEEHSTHMASESAAVKGDNGGGHPPRSHHMARMPARPSVHGPLTDNTIGKMSALPEGWSSIVCLHGGMIVERSESNGKVLLRGATRSFGHSEKTANLNGASIDPQLLDGAPSVPDRTCVQPDF